MALPPVHGKAALLLLLFDRDRLPRAEPHGALDRGALRLRRLGHQQMGAVVFADLEHLRRRLLAAGVPLAEIHVDYDFHGRLLPSAAVTCHTVYEPAFPVPRPRRIA